MADDQDTPDTEESPVKKYAKKFWGAFKEGFKPMEARSYTDSSEPNQYAEDKKLSPSERVAKFQKGFLGGGK